MVLPGDPPEVYYGIDECGNCHAELDNGRHICMSNFTVPSTGTIIMTVSRNGKTIESIELEHGDDIEFEVIEMEAK